MYHRCYDPRFAGHSPTPDMLDASIVIAAPCEVVFRAFFDHGAMSAWWQVARSVTTPRTLGPYVVEWVPTDFRDEVLGRLGGVFHGTVLEIRPSRGFIVAEAYWLPPDGDPIGPMALEVACEPAGVNATHVRVTQTGFEESIRWRRYYDVIQHGWERALVSLKALLEH